MLKLLTFICVFLCGSGLFVVIVDPSLAYKLHRKFNSVGPELRSYYRETVAYHLRVDKNVPVGAHLFVGDSHVQGLCVPCVTRLGINFGIGADTTVGVAHRLAQYASVQRAQSVFLSVGVNDLKYRSVSELLQNYSALIDTLPEAADVFVNAVWPVNPNIDARWRAYPEKINRLNQQLERLCGERDNCRYFDVTNELKDSAGYLRVDLQVGDAIHLNHKGYSLVIAMLKKAYLGYQ